MIVPTPAPVLPVLPVPVRTSWSERFWTGLAEGRFLLQRCTTCTSLQGYPKPQCHACGATTMAWEASSGRGTVYSHTTIESNPPTPFLGELPYTLVIVELPEGVRYLARYEGTQAAACGMAVHAVYHPRRDGTILPTFAESTP